MKLKDKRVPVSKNFFLDEYFPKETYYSMSKEEMLKLIDPKVIEINQLLRNIYGPAILNTWWYPDVPDPREYAGWRPKDCIVGAKKSTHKDGKASDLIFATVSAEEVRKSIKDQGITFFNMGIRRIENDVLWFHWDLKSAAGQKTIKFFNA